VRYRQIAAISGKGSGNDQFTAVLRAVAVSRNGQLYAVGDREVKVFSPAGQFVRRWQTLRPAYCAFLEEPKGEFVVWVGQSGVVERFDENGRNLGGLRDSGRLGTVTAVAVHGDDVFLADASARCIRRYSRAGKWQSDIGKDNNTRGFLIPNGYLDLRIDEAGIIHAANPAKHRIERYSASGDLLGHFGKFGMHRSEDFGGCCNPTNLALLPGKRIAVTEKAPPRLKVFDAAGALLAVVGPEPFHPNCKNMALAADSHSRIYVCDTERLQILVFAPEPVPGSLPAGAASATQEEGS